MFCMRLGLDLISNMNEDLLVFARVYILLLYVKGNRGYMYRGYFKACGGCENEHIFGSLLCSLMNVYIMYLCYV